MSNNKCKSKREALALNRPAKANNELSLPSGKDESGLFNVVRDQLHAFKSVKQAVATADALWLAWGIGISRAEADSAACVIEDRTLLRPDKSEAY